MRDKRSLNINIQQPETNQMFQTRNSHFASASKPGSQGSTGILKKQTSVSTCNGGSGHQQRRQTPLPHDHTTTEHTPCREVSEEREQQIPTQKFALTSVKAKPKKVTVVPHQHHQCIWLPERLDNQPQGFRKPAPPPKTSKAK
jgi:hypothetical protein